MEFMADKRLLIASEAACKKDKEGMEWKTIGGGELEV